MIQHQSGFIGGWVSDMGFGFMGFFFSFFRHSDLNFWMVGRVDLVGFVLTWW